MFPYPPPPPPFLPPMMPPPPPGFGPPPGMGGYGEPMGFLLPGLIKGIVNMFRPSTPSAPPPPPPSVSTSVSYRPGLPPLPELFYRNRPQFCQVFCPPGGGMQPMMSPGFRRRRRRRLSGFGAWSW
jgi:hypothetical protein